MRVLVPVDGSKATEVAVDRGLAMLAGLPGVKVTFLNVRQEGFQEPADAQYVAETFEADEDDEVFPSEASSGRALDRCIAIAKRHRVAAEPKVVVGRYRDVILEESAGFDLLLMHALGASNLRDALRGSGTEHLARHAPCAVLLVPADG